MNRNLLEQLYRQFYREIYLYIFSICKNRTAAEDLAQETFLKAILALPDSHTNTRAWLYTVARNLTLNAVKKSTRETEEFCEAADASAGDPLSEILQKEQYRDLYRALSKLPALKKEILIMQYFGRLSHKEIAAVLHLRTDNVRALASRGRKELKKYLEEES